MRHEQTIVIAAPDERIWSVMADVERWPEWTDSITEVTPLEPGELRLGSRFRVRQPKLPPAVWEVTALVPGRTFTWTNRSPGLTTTGAHTVEDGRVTLALEQAGPLSFLTRPVRGLTQRYVRMEAEGLKRRCEQTG